MAKKSKIEKDRPVTKDDLLMAVDSAIGHLVTLRTLIDVVLREPAVESVPVAPRNPHEDHNVQILGFGSDPYCLDCGQDVGVSSEAPSEVQP